MHSRLALIHVYLYSQPPDCPLRHYPRFLFPCRLAWKRDCTSLSNLAFSMCLWMNLSIQAGHSEVESVVGTKVVARSSVSIYRIMYQTYSIQAAVLKYSFTGRLYASAIALQVP